MAGDLRQYGFEDTITLVNGVNITDFAEGDDSVTISREVESFTKVVSNNGNVTAVKSPDRSGAATLNLQQNSPSNSFLNGLLATSETSNTIIPVTFVFKDVRGDDLIAATKGFMTTYPEVVRGAGMNTMTWVIALARVDFVIGVSNTL